MRSARTPAAIHYKARIVLNVFINQRKVSGVTSQVTRKPGFSQHAPAPANLSRKMRRRAARSGELRSCTSRATQTDSAAAGMPRKPNRVEVNAFAHHAPEASETSSEWFNHRRSSERQ